MRAVEVKGRRWRSCFHSLAIALLCCAGLVLGQGTRAFASEMVFGGWMTASDRNTRSDTGQDSEQTELTGTLQGNGFIWRPWFATSRIKLNFSQTKTELEQEAEAGRREMKYELVSGKAIINWFPQSHFPLNTFMEVSDSRIESETVGVPLEDINILRRERFGLTQAYRPLNSRSNYSLQAVRTRLFENDLDGEDISDIKATGSHRFKKQSLAYNLNFRETVRNEASIQRNENMGGFSMRHSYQPDQAFTIMTSFNFTRNEELQNPDTLADGFEKRDDSTSLTSHMSWRSKDNKWTARGNLSALRNRTFQETAKEEETNIASAGITYEITPSLRLLGNVGNTRTRSKDQQETEQSIQNATLKFTPTPFPLGGFQYHWNAQLFLGNTNTSENQSLQSGTLGLNHGLEKVVGNDKGRNVTLSLNEGVTQLEDSGGTRQLTVNHLGSVAVLWTRPSSTSLIQMALSDTRITGNEADSQQNIPIDRVTRRVNLVGSHQVRITRLQSLDGNVNLGATRVNDRGEENRSRSYQASAGYTVNHALFVDKLRFRSRLEYAGQRSESGSVDNEEQVRGSWDNRLDYTVGLLTLAVRRTMTRVGRNQTVVTVFSASRRF